MNVTIYATNMIYAQGATLTKAQRAELLAKADRFREITGTTDETNISVPVIDPRSGSMIGHMTYKF